MNSPQRSKTLQQIRYLIADLFATELAFWVFNIVRFYLLEAEHSIGGSLWDYIGSAKLVLEQCIVPPCLLFIYWLSGYYNNPLIRSRLQEFSVTFFTAWINTIIIYLVLLINDQTGQRKINYEMIIILFGLLFFCTYSLRWAITEFTLSQYRKEKWHRRVLIIGNSKVSRKVAKHLVSSNKAEGYVVCGFVSIPGENDVKNAMGTTPVVPFNRIENAIKEYEVDQVILAPENHDDKKVMKLLSVLFPLKIPVKISPDTFSFVTSSIRMKDIYAEPFVDLTGPAISEASKNIKRSFDVSMSLFIMLALSPLYLVLALIVKFSSPGGIFYSQERIGRYQRPFNIYKFRTMVQDAEKEGPQLSSSDDPRVTPIGKWMRKYRFDELPQFFNVLKGEMSIVGPRPEREFYIKQIVEKAPYYTLVCQVRPGITSWGMVKYGYASTVTQMVERTRYDLIYLANMSLSVDMKILIYTIKTVIGGEGV